MQKLEEVDRLVKELSTREKALHVLVNNAGAAWGATLDDYPVRPRSFPYRKGPWSSRNQTVPEFQTGTIPIPSGNGREEVRTCNLNELGSNAAKFPYADR